MLDRDRKLSFENKDCRGKSPNSILSGSTIPLHSIRHPSRRDPSGIYPEAGPEYLGLRGRADATGALDMEALHANVLRLAVG